MRPPTAKPEVPILPSPEHLEEILETGRAARDLIQHPSYTAAMQTMEAFHVSAMIAAPEGPKGAEARDHHHRMYAALRELASELAARAQAATDIEAKADDDVEEDDEP